MNSGGADSANSYFANWVHFGRQSIAFESLQTQFRAALNVMMSGT